MQNSASPVSPANISRISIKEVGLIR